MIDVDTLEDQLEVAVAHGLRGHPAAGRAPGPEDLLEKGRLAEADALAAARFPPEGAHPGDGVEAVAWATMRALLEGRAADARSGVERLSCVGLETRDASLTERSWAQRASVVLTWGDDDETDQLLDHCRARCYRDDDLWWGGTLALVLGRLGRAEEAARVCDTALTRLASLPATDRDSFEVLADLAETAAILGDGARAERVAGAGIWRGRPAVVVGRGPVVKGATARFRGLVYWAQGRFEGADQQLAAAVDLHRRLGATPLVARVLGEWGRALAGRDDLRSRACLEESAELARRLATATPLVA